MLILKICAKAKKDFENKIRLFFILFYYKWIVSSTKTLIIFCLAYVLESLNDSNKQSNAKLKLGVAHKHHIPLL